MNVTQILNHVSHMAVEQVSHVGFLLSAHLVVHELAQVCHPHPCKKLA